MEEQIKQVALPVLEITLLKVNSAYNSWSSDILATLQQTRYSIAEKVTPTASRFYRSLSFPTDILILGIWPCLQDHTNFLSNEDLRNEILGSQEGMFDFRWSRHVDIPEGEEDIVRRKLGGRMDWLKVMRRRDGEGIESRSWMEDQEKDRVFEIVKGWCCGSREEGKEYLRVVGWKGGIIGENMVLNNSESDSEAGLDMILFDMEGSMMRHAVGER